VVAATRSQPYGVWGSTAAIAADGTFVLESLPADETLQLVALCDGWVSQSPSASEVAAASAENAFQAQYRGPQANMIYSRVYRLEGPAIHPIVPMDPTANCEVTIHDQKGVPISGASVAFWPNQNWHHYGSNILGEGADSATLLRAQRTSAARQSMLRRKPVTTFSATTDAKGVALVRNLPVGGDSADPSPRELPFRVSHDGYRSTSEPLGGSTKKVKLAPGKTGQITVELERR
jgi:hypothetical protein